MHTKTAPVLTAGVGQLIPFSKVFAFLKMTFLGACDFIQDRVVRTVFSLLHNNR